MVAFLLYFIRKSFWDDYDETEFEFESDNCDDIDDSIPFNLEQFSDPSFIVYEL